MGEAILPNVDSSGFPVSDEPLTEAKIWWVASLEF